MAAAAGSMARVRGADTSYPASPLLPLWATWIGHLTLVWLSGVDRRADRLIFFCQSIRPFSLFKAAPVSTARAK